MKRFKTIGLIILAAVITVSMTVYAFANAPEGGGMGVWGYVADADDASLEVMDQPGAETLVVDEVKAPGKAWIVVHMDDNGMPGMRVGLKAIDEGTSRNVRVELEEVDGEKVIVAVHADKGERGEFEFDMEDADHSPDRPFFVDRMELAMPVVVR